MTSTGLMKVATELTMDSLTGSGNTMALINEQRMAADERTLKRIDDLDPAYLNRKAAENTHLDAR